MKEYFVVADVHSFFTIMKDELRKKGFDENNPNHILITCGDFFDRGEEAKELLDFLYNLYQLDRLLMVRGNHDDLFEMMVANNYPGMHDYQNGTLGTLCQLQKEPVSIDFGIKQFLTIRDTYDERYKFLLTKMKNYIEIGKYIFIHGWIPTNEEGLYDPEWRNAPDEAWSSYKGARWVNGMEQWKNGIREPGKTIVCGHWHCSYGWSHIDRKYKEFPQLNHAHFEKAFEPWCKDGIIALDACTVYSKKINVLHLTESEVIGDEEKN